MVRRFLRLPLVLAFLVALTPGAVVGQGYDTSGNLRTRAAQGAGTGTATGYWSLRLSNGTSFTDFFASAGITDNFANPTTTGVMSFGMLWDSAAWDRAPGNSTDGALVNLGANNDVTVTGTVTANAGTDLNTSTLLTTSAHDAAFGTAGTADTQVRTIQGIASMTPVTVSATDLDVRIGGSDTVTVTATDLDIRNLNATDDIVQARGAAADGAAVTGNPVLVAGQDGTNAQSIKTDTTGTVQVDIESSATLTVTDGAGAMNVIVDSITAGDTDIGNVDLEFAGAAASVNNGATDATTQRVTISNDSTGEVRIADDGGNQIPSSTATMALNSRGLNVRRVSADPCGNEKITPFNVNLASATTTLVATGVASEHVYICTVNLVVGGAQGIAFIAGTGATCGTSTAGMNGGTTGATGWQFGANGGIALPNAGFSHMSTEISGGATGDSVCIVTSTTAQTSGTIGYVIQVP